MGSGVVSDVSTLFYVTRYLGLTPYLLPEFTLSLPHLWFSAFCIVSLVVNFVMFVESQVMVYSVNFFSHHLTPFALSSYAIITIIQSTRNRTRVAKVFRKLNKMDVQLKCIGLQAPSYERTANRRLLVLLLVLVMHQAPELMLWMSDMYVFHPSYFWCLVYCQAVRFSTELHFISYLHFIFVRLEVINRKMKTFGESKLLFVRDFNYQQSDKTYEETLQMKLLLRVHNELCRVAHLTCNVFQVQILLSIASFFSYITSNMYYLSITLLNQGDDLSRGFRKLVVILYSTYWMIAVFLELLIIVSACTRSVRSAEKTAALCHDIQVKERLPHLHIEVLTAPNLAILRFLRSKNTTK